MAPGDWASPAASLLTVPLRVPAVGMASTVLAVGPLTVLAVGMASTVLAPEMGLTVLAVLALGTMLPVLAT